MHDDFMDLALFVDKTYMSIVAICMHVVMHAIAMPHFKLCCKVIMPYCKGCSYASVLLPLINKSGQLCCYNYVHVIQYRYNGKVQWSINHLYRTRAYTCSCN